MNKFLLVILALVLIASQAMKMRDSSSLGSGNPPDQATQDQIMAALSEYSDEIQACDADLWNELVAKVQGGKDSSGKDKPARR